jgi:PAS domain S-box-containing protein
MSKVIPAQLPEDGSLFHVLVESVQDYAIFALDANGRIATWNGGARQIKGYTADEAIGQHFSLFFTDEERAADRPGRLLQMAATVGRAEDEGWRVRKDGSRFWASAIITALRSRGEIIGFAKITRDLTERRASEEAIRRRERQLSDAQELAGMGSWEWDVLEGEVTWSDELFRIYGVDAQSFKGTFGAYLQLVHPDDRDRVRGEVEGAFREGREFDFDERIVRPDGSVRVLRSRGRAVRDESGRTTHLLGSCLDITDLRAAQEKALALVREQAAREAAEALTARLRFLVRASEALASDMDHETTFRAVANLAVPEIADWCAVDLVDGAESLIRAAAAPAGFGGRETADAMHQTAASRRGARFIRHVVETGEASSWPDGGSHTQDQPFPDGLGLQSAVVAPLPGRGGTVGALTLARAGSHRPIDDNDTWLARELGRHLAAAAENARLHRELQERNRLLEEQSTELELQTEELQTQMAHNEELLMELESANDELQQRTHEAEQANRAKSEFLAAMSHELRTPLNAIFGYADLIQLGLYGPVTPAQHGSLDRIKRNQNALLLLINDVLNFAKLEAGGLHITMAELPVAEVISDLEAVVGPQLRDKGLSYQYRVCAPEPRVTGDRERIQQVLLNLLTNAIKFTDKGGRLTLAVDVAEDRVLFRVSDTGCGIPADRMEVIFDPFVQVGRYAGDSGERGVGLGLAISRDLAEAMGGTLTVESAVGAGSTFTLALPRVQTA